MDMRATFVVPVAPWGKNLAVCLPAAVVEALDLKAGDEVEIYVADARERAASQKAGRDELLKQLLAFRGRLPADFRFDRNETNARSLRRRSVKKRQVRR